MYYYDYWILLTHYCVYIYIGKKIIFLRVSVLCVRLKVKNKLNIVTYNYLYPQSSITICTVDDITRFSRMR